jgi:VWFA-related protein
MIRAVSLLCCSLLLGQQDATFSTGVKVVNVLATVRDKHGKIVQNLAKEDFTLAEDGRTQTIRYFSRETNLPLTLGLLVDISGSQRRVLPAESRASYQFLQQVLREDKDMAFVIHFDREVELLQDLTSSRRKLEQALGSLAQPVQTQQQPRGRGGRGGGGGTSLYDAAMLASDDVMKNQSGRKAVIVLSDGVDTSSKVSVERAIEAAQRADTMIYSILFSDDQAYGLRPGISMGGRGRGRGGGGGGQRPGGMQHPDGKKILQHMARETGGGFFEVSNKEPIEKVFSQIEEELRSQYNLGYSSDQPEGSAGFRAIRVTSKQRDLAVQTRSGYYAGQ